MKTQQGHSFTNELVFNLFVIHQRWLLTNYPLPTHKDIWRIGLPFPVFSFTL